MLDAHAVIAVLATVRWAEPDVLLAEKEVDDLLRAAVALNTDVLLETERSKQLEIEGESALDIAYAEIDVLDAARGAPREYVLHARETGR